MRLQVQSFNMKKFFSKNFRILKIRRSFSFVGKKSSRGFEIEIVLTQRKNKPIEGSLVVTKF